VLAHRLAEEKKSILVIEAGSDPNGVQSIDIPLMADSVRGTEFDWQYHTVPQKSACLGHINRVHLHAILYFFTYYPRDAIPARYLVSLSSRVRLSIRPSVCLSQAVLYQNG